MLRRLFPVLIPVLLFAPALAGQAPAAATATPDDPVVAAILAEWERDCQVMPLLDELVNGIGPRLTGSTNLTEACEWTAQRFREWGLENVRLEPWGTFPVGFDRRLARGRLVQPVKRPLTFGTAAWSPGTNGAVRGPVKLAPASPEELEAARGTLRGAWVLPGQARPRWDSAEDDFGSQLGRFLDEEGIAGVLRARGELIHTGGGPPQDMEHLPRRVSINLLGADAGRIQKLLAEGKTVEAEFDIDQRFVPGPVPLYNVLAEIPGTEKPEELVIVGGHIDSWDGATGTQDNGTGVATTLEAARLLAKAGARPRRTIRFMLWSGEEQGLLGSRAYIEQHPEENPRISAVLVHDGGTNAISGIAATPAIQPVFERALAPLLAVTADNPDEDKRFRIRPVDSLPVGIGSDHDAYLMVGVPGFYWSQSGAADYNFIHHTQHDVFEHAVEEDQRHSARVVAVAAWRLANEPELLPREGLTTPPRRLGVSLAQGTLRIERVGRGSLAEKAGLQPGDVLVQVDGTALQDEGDLRRAVRGGGARKDVVVDRNGQRLAFWVDWENQTGGPAAPAGL